MQLSRIFKNHGDLYGHPSSCAVRFLRIENATVQISAVISDPELSGAVR